MYYNGNIAGTSKINFFKECSIFIFPSQFENSSVILREAIASKMAIIAINIDANKNILHDKGNSTYFEVGNPIKMADEITKMIISPLKV